MLYVLDYGAGNIQSLANSLTRLGHSFEWVRSPEDLDKADRLIFPGVGSFGHAMEALARDGYAEPLRRYIASGRPYMGICIGMQVLFAESEENPGTKGLGVIPARVVRFSSQDSEGRRKAVPHMGWSRAVPLEFDQSNAPAVNLDDYYYYVHSYRVPYAADAADWAFATTQYGDERFVSVVQTGNVFATQFHPEKSGAAGLALLDAWIRHEQTAHVARQIVRDEPQGYTLPTRRIVACLDVRSNDDGDLVVTKGESYDVRDSGEGHVRNMGKPVELAERYFKEGADEIAFLNITSFRACPLRDQPMLELLHRAAATVFVPLTIGGGIRDTVDPDGTPHPALEVAHAYFRAGADKVSIGGDAVFAVEKLLERAAEAGRATHDPAQAPAEAVRGDSPMEQINAAYGAQAVVVSIDPRRVYCDEVPAEHAMSAASGPDEREGREGQPAKWWYRCTVKGGREDRDIDAVQLARGAARLGAGELMINSIDRDGSGRGFDTQLIDLVRGAVDIPVIASSGAGCAQHFADVFATRAATGGASIEAALAAGIFHRHEVAISDAKKAVQDSGLPVRLSH
ncbi:dCMP deaminase [Malassezia cuniculi]|uniref:dCMP deaminase n=1 Tax=Malassezia cuniculi TaxID=948313 RepID=A0AAF0J5U5_9BASI|nr:dCMP deaminase [Malassezia cuniculi]